jgi:hypothetical protein
LLTGSILDSFTLSGSILSHSVFRRHLYWILLAFIPSSLLFGVTTYITTEIAPTPLLWTIPLALYPDRTDL